MTWARRPCGCRRCCRAAPGRRCSRSTPRAGGSSSSGPCCTTSPTSLGPVPAHALLGGVEHALGASARGRAGRLLAGRRLRPRGPAERPDVHERPGLPRPAGVRARRRPAQRALAVLGQGGHAARAAVPRVADPARRGRGRRRRRAPTPPPRSSRRPSRWRRRWRSAPWPTASRSTWPAAPRVASPSAGEALLDECCHYALAARRARSRPTSGHRARQLSRGPARPWGWGSW